MKNEFKRFEFSQDINPEMLEGYHFEAFQKIKEMYPEAVDISCDSLDVDVMVGERFLTFQLGMCDGEVAIKDNSGKIIKVCELS